MQAFWSQGRPRRRRGWPGLLLALLLLPVAATAAPEQRTATVATCVATALQRPPYFSYMLDGCLESLPTSAVLDGLLFVHPRAEVQERVRALVSRRLILARTALTPSDAPRLLALVRSEADVRCRLELVQTLSQKPAGRAELARSLDTAPHDAFHLMAAIAYLDGGQFAAFPQPVVRGFPTNEAALPAGDRARLESLRAEIRDAYLTRQPFSALSGLATWLYQEYGVTSRGDQVFHRPVMAQGDAWLCSLGEKDESVAATGKRAREYVEDRLLRGDPSDAARLLESCAISHDREPRSWAIDIVARWVVQLKPEDLASATTQLRFIKLMEVIRQFADSAWWPLRMPETSDLGPRPDYPLCAGTRVDRQYSPADLMRLGLRAPEAPGQVTAELPPGVIQKLVAALPVFQRRLPHFKPRLPEIFLQKSLLETPSY